MGASVFCIVLAICTLAGVSYIIWRTAKDKAAFREEADRNSQKCLAALAEAAERIDVVLSELTQKTGSIDKICSELATKSTELLTAQMRIAQGVTETGARVESCSESIALAHGLLAAAALRDVSGETDLEKVIGEGAVQKHVACRSQQRVLLVTDTATGSETRYTYRENGQIGSETRVHGKLKFSVAFSPDGVPTEGFVFGDGEKPMQKFIYDDYGQVKERVAL